MSARRKNSLKLLTLLLLAGCAMTSACKREPKHKTPLQRGHWLYTTRCAHCHGAYGKGDGRRVSGPVQPRNLADPKVYETLSDAAIENVVRKGKGEMPAFGEWIKGPQMKDLIAYLHTLPSKAAKAPN